MRIFEALLIELQRLESVSDEQFDQEMKTNKDFGILVFAAKEELKSIAWGALLVPVWEKDGEDKDRVNTIVEKVLREKH